MNYEVLQVILWLRFWFLEVFKAHPVIYLLALTPPSPNVLDKPTLSWVTSRSLLLQDMREKAQVQTESNSPKPWPEIKHF